MSLTAIAPFAFYMAISIADIVTTERAIRHGAREANPVMRWLMEQIGRDGAYAVKLVVAAAIGVAAMIYVPQALAMGGLMAIGTVLGVGLFLGSGCWVVWHNWNEV